MAVPNLVNKLEKYFISKQKQIEEQLRSLEKDDPVMLSDIIPEVSELGTDAWQAEVHNKVVVMRNNLQTLSAQIKNSLNRLNVGSYGKCEKCGRHIELERLQVLPTATICIACLALKTIPTFS